MSDFLIGMAVSVILQVVQEGNQSAKWRKAFLKLFRAIAMAYRTDQEFKDVAVTAKMLG